MKTLTLKTLNDAVSGTAAAFRSRTEYQPAGGEGTPVFPPTYEGGKYATVGYREEKETGRKLADQVVLDSVQSQANRMELELLYAWERQRIGLPVITVDFSGHDLERDLRVTSLEAPHRVADAILRDSLLEGLPFRKSELGRRFDDVDNRNATVLFEMCPTALLFGIWDSTGPKGGLGAKFQRAIVSEIIGLQVQLLVKTSSRMDPLQISKHAGPIYERKDSQNNIEWTFKVEEATSQKGKPKLFDRGTSSAKAKAGEPSKANHCNYPPSIDNVSGGVIFKKSVQTTVISLPALRRLCFPLEPGQRSAPEVDDAARTVLAALGLCAAVLTREAGCDLRSRCQLFPTQAITWELLDKPGEAPESFELTGEKAIELFNDSVKAAKQAGLPWMDQELILTPSPELVELVKRSQQLATVDVVEED